MSGDLSMTDALLAPLGRREATRDRPEDPVTRVPTCVPMLEDVSKNVLKPFIFSQIFTDDRMVLAVPRLLTLDVYAEHNDTIAQAPHLLLTDGFPGLLQFRNQSVSWLVDRKHFQEQKRRGHPGQITMPIDEHNRICLRLVLGEQDRNAQEPSIVNTLRGFCLMNNPSGRRAVNLINGIRKEAIKEEKKRCRSMGLPAPMPAEGRTMANKSDSDDYWTQDEEEEEEEEEDYAEAEGYWDDGTS